MTQPMMTTSRQFLAGLSAERFLSEHWQREPLLCRSALPKSRFGIGRKELLALATRADVEARLITRDGASWQLERGPLSKPTIKALPETDWTVLVSDLEVHVPELARVLRQLDFLPSWRIDDLMASYAVDGGSVGPHFDSYDVFLLQVQGKRRWQIAQRFDRTKLRGDTELCILDEFVAEQEWLLEPGDMLYLPPRIAHYGVAEGECVTFSLGCRAPSLKELAMHFALNAVDRAPSVPLQPETLGFEARERAAELRLQGASLAGLQSTLADLFTFDSECVRRAFASLVSQPKALFALEAEELPSQRRIARALSGKSALARRRGSRWLSLDLTPASYLYVDGEEYDASAAIRFARKLCETQRLGLREVQAALKSAPERALLSALVQAGQLVISS